LLDAVTGRPRVRAGYELRGPDGRTYRRREPSLITPGPTGKVSRLMGVPLEGFPRGSTSSSSPSGTRSPAGNESSGSPSASRRPELRWPSDRPSVPRLAVGLPRLVLGDLAAQEVRQLSGARLLGERPCLSRGPRAVPATRCTCSSRGSSGARGPALEHADLPGPPPRTHSARVGGRAAFPFGRCLSPRLMTGSGDHLPDLPTAASAGLTALRLVETHLEQLLRLWPERFANAHGPLRPVVERVLRGFLKCGIVPHWLRTALVRNVPDERAVSVFLPWKELLPLMREEKTAPVGRVVAEGGARARPPSSRRADDATAPAFAVSEAPRAPARPRAMRGAGHRRVHERTGRTGSAARIVVSIATSGDLMQWHLHGHC
jgi:hypothetical protein